MKIELKNLGIIKQTDFCLGDMTIICGKNNTGKTYATHATYAFFDYLLSNANFSIQNDEVDQLLTTGVTVLKLAPYFDNLKHNLDKSAKEYSGLLHSVFAGDENRFIDSEFKFSFLSEQQFKPSQIINKVQTINNTVLQIKSSESNEELEIRLSVEKDNEDIPPKQILKRILGESIAKSILQSLIPTPFLASAERTGAAIFQKELDFTKNRLVEMLGDKSTNLHPIQFLSKFTGEYPIAIRRNVDFIRSLPNITHRESFIAKEHLDILEYFKDIIGGEYKVTKDGEVNFISANAKSKKLSIVESSSAVRSLLDIGFYLRHVAQKGDLLMIDEPELNLHPENQRKIARLFARLVNIGIKVFITTHSDYIVKELSILIALNNDDEKYKRIVKEYNYTHNELINHKSINVYIAEKIGKSKNAVFTQAQVDSVQGIDAKSFNSAINEMNKIQEDIVWGE